jgi:photosystem II stability/assembly factor-like uncharacterized protein
VSFLDHSHGWVTGLDPVGESAWMQRTFDGGASWTKPMQIPAFGPTVFTDLRHGWVAETFYSEPHLFSTDDGGRTRVERDVRAAARAGDWRLAYETPTFFNTAYGIEPVVVYGARMARMEFLLTSNGGASWSRISTLILPRPHRRRRGPPEHQTFVATSADWWILDADPPRLYVTSDAGRHWRMRRLPFHLPAGQLTAIDSKHAWIVSGSRRHERLLATRDSGATWKQLLPVRTA